MIIELTKDNLQKCGFDNEQILKLLEWDNYAMSFFLNDTCYYATNIEKKIYTEIDGFKKHYFENGTIAFPMDCPDLIPTYFDLFLKKYLERQEELLNTMFVEADQKEIFINKQILAVKNEIDENKEKILKRIHTDIYHKKDSIYNSYLRLLENKLNEQPQQTEFEPLDLSDTSAVEKIIVVKEPYGEMFTNNGFELFEYILNEYVKPKNTTGRYEDLSYYYRCLFEDKFIHQRPEPFRIWFIEKYKEEFTKIKTIQQATSPQRKKDYSSALDWFKPQNK
jgi:hypothetical protein